MKHFELAIFIAGLIFSASTVYGMLYVYEQEPRGIVVPPYLLIEALNR